MIYYLDSCTVISMLKDPKQTTKDVIRSISSKNIKIPSMVKAELIAGAYKSHDVESIMDKTKRIIAPYEIIPFDDGASEIYGKIRAELEMKGRPIDSNDMVIAATVLSRGGILVTSDTKEYSRVTGLRIEDWCK
ncbi:MAG: type II toxin-antitoxin system VapC family toxin [Methanomassiliicoccaceae archaeon]|jgi:tRNA(fMet)-specific endonuclease VapC|nr:type II toxin-antitoxin system VapC family toxin [Methanomassiliicoccaceae archaeon]